MQQIIPISGIFLFLAFSFLISEKRSAIRWRPLALNLCVLGFLAFFFLATSPGIRFQEASGSGIAVLVHCADAGTQSLFSPKLMEDGLYCAALSILPPIIFIGALTAVLFHLGILPFLIRVFAWFVTRIAGITGAEALIATANIFLGMVEAPFAVRPYLAKFTRSELFCMMTSGMATIAGGVMVAYAGMLQKVGTPPGHLVIASILSVFSAILLAKIMIPETEKTRFDGSAQSEGPRDVNLLDAACRGATEGTTLALNVLGIMIAFMALIVFVNLLLGLFGNVSGSPLTLQRLFAWGFSPLAWLLGIPWSECGFAGQLLGEKTVLNEFLAYMDLTQPENLARMSDRSRIIMTYALCGFANFGSLAIMVGGVSGLIPERRAEMAQLAWRSLISGTLAAFITACLAAIFTV